MPLSSNHNDVDHALPFWQASEPTLVLLQRGVPIEISLASPPVFSDRMLVNQLVPRNYPSIYSLSMLLQVKKQRHQFSLQQTLGIMSCDDVSPKPQERCVRCFYTPNISKWCSMVQFLANYGQLWPIVHACPCPGAFNKLLKVITLGLANLLCICLGHSKAFAQLWRVPLRAKLVTTWEVSPLSHWDIFLEIIFKH